MTPLVLARSILALVVTVTATAYVSIAVVIALALFRRPEATGHRMAQWWGRTICRVSGVRVRLEGGEGLDPGQPRIFAANHQSQYDIFALQGHFPHDFRWLAKKELFRIPFFGRGMRLAGYIPVDREHGRAALRSLDEAAARIAAGTSVLIFPEGTRSRDGRLQPLKTGGMVLAIKSGVPVVPVAILGSRDVLPRGRLLPRPGAIVLRIGAPIATAGLRLRQKQELADRVRDSLAALLEA